MALVDQDLKTLHYAIKIGDVEVVSLQDGMLYVPVTVIEPDGDAAEKKRIEEILPNPLIWSNNVFLIYLDGKRILIDAGGGDLFAPESGQLIAGLAGVGIRPADITDICLTHLHPDHIGGLTLHGNVAFPKARLHVAKAELDYWIAEESRQSAPEHHRVFFEALERFLPYLNSGSVETFEDNEEVFRGLRSHLLPGHTPGLSAFTLSSRHDRVMFLGDLFNEPAQVEHPDLKLRFDWDSDLAIETRKKTLEFAVRENLLVAPPHAAFPGFFKVEKNSGIYRLRQETLPREDLTLSSTASR
ncbi:MAG: MBL fold metallo-hydrolase [Edaphobacter sp.]|uniref:MBL fold metallo-hydrolase n=1 Tax=Edaphobacter sp. TaxID=1934404 RepID=UPI00238BBB96|nr:MBL fold metallo-hydrolase [Edaphobacter sp.]MDE1175696.1 MBL fold metallo-hydrolase [Edaphobacter sp.]